MHNNINLYFKERNNKYLLNNLLIKNFNNDYFKEWLSGFIEAEGCFTLRKNNFHSFNIAQKNETELLEYIKKYFEIQSKVRKTKGNIGVLETYRKSTLINIINHCSEFPLLGEKYLSFILFKTKILK